MIMCKTEMNNGIAKIVSSVLLLIGQAKFWRVGFDWNIDNYCLLSFFVFVVFFVSFEQVLKIPNLLYFEFL